MEKMPRDPPWSRRCAHLAKEGLVPAKDSPRKAVSPRSFARTQETRNQFDAPSHAPALGVRAHQSARPPQRSPEILTPQPAVPFVPGTFSPFTFSPLVSDYPS